jgi:hypothetical protein
LLNESNKAGLIILISVLFGIYCFVFGQSGILERMHLHTIKDKIDSQIERLESENDALFSTYLQYKKGKYLKQESELSGFIAEGEKVIIFKSSVKSQNKRDGESQQSLLTSIENEQTQTSQLRILWIILSFIVIFLYVIKNQSKVEKQEEVQ